MTLRIVHLFEQTEHLPTVARWIHREWWQDKDGHTEESMAARLREATDADRIPLSLLAVLNGQPVGTINLVENDDEKRTHLYPWLAALLVIPEYRRRGIGSELVKELQRHAVLLGIEEMYLGTDSPGFYSQIGAAVYEPVTSDFIVMKLGSTSNAHF